MSLDDAHHFLAAVTIHGWPSDRLSGVFGGSKQSSEVTHSPEEFAEMMFTRKDKT